MRSPRRKLLYLLAFLLISRILFATVVWKIDGPAGFRAEDTGSYLAPARSLLQGAFSDAAGRPEVIRTPGYPIVLVPAVISGHAPTLGVIENVLFSLASAWLLWQISLAILPGSEAAVWAVALYCLEPIGWLLSEKILSETLFCTLLLLFVWLLIRFLKVPGRGRLLLSALALASAAYTRPIALGLALCLVPFLLLFPRALTSGRRARCAGLFAASFAVLIAPWLVRNVVVADYPGFSAVTARSLYFYMAGTVRAKLEHRTLEDFFRTDGRRDDTAYFHVHPEQRNWAPGRIYRFWSDQGIHTILQHPFLYAGIHLRGGAVVLFDTGITDFLKLLHLYPSGGGLLSRTLDQGFLRSLAWLIRRAPLSIVILPLLATQLFVYYLLAIAGVPVLSREVRWLFFVSAAYLVIASGTPGAVARFRAPIMPLVCLTAGTGMERIRKRRQSQAGSESLPLPTLL